MYSSESLVCLSCSYCLHWVSTLLCSLVYWSALPCIFMRSSVLSFSPPLCQVNLCFHSVVSFCFIFCCSLCLLFCLLHQPDNVYSNNIFIPFTFYIKADFFVWVMPVSWVLHLGPPSHMVKSMLAIFHLLFFFFLFFLQVFRLTSSLTYLHNILLLLA